MKTIGLILLNIVFVGIFLSQTTDAASSEFKISAFNIQIFGRAKVANKDALDTIVEIVKRYDIILIQEIRDSSGEAILTLLEEVNKGSVQYEMTISERLGRSTSKEQYAYLYRESSKLTVKDTYQYPDTLDKFERPPFCVLFQSLDTDITEFALIGSHTSPSKAFDEINALKDVHDNIASHWNTDDIMIMGDLNADCSYVSKSKLEQLTLRTPSFDWLIPDDADTTLAATDCAYDRFIVSGNKFQSAVVPNSAGVFPFDKEYSLTAEKAKEVSDHYPIEFSLELGGQSSSAAPSLDNAIVNVIEWMKERLEL